MPLLHIVGQTALYYPEQMPEALASYQDNAFFLSDYSRQLSNGELELYFNWYSNGDAEGDYRFFVHLYSDVDLPPIVQHDAYPRSNTPPGNWLPGPGPDHVMIDLSAVPPGTYTLAIGFYDPYTSERLMPESDVYQVSADGRLFLSEVEIPGED
jgi:hypothetical protein